MLCILLPVWKTSLAQQSSQGVVTQTIQFSSADITLDTVIAPTGQAFTKVRYEGLPVTQDVGSPELPVKYLHLIVPPDVVCNQVTIQSAQSVNIPIGPQVYPAQYKIPTNEESPLPEFAPPDKTVYSSRSPYPAQPVKYISDGYFDGNKHIVTVAVYPALYTPVGNKLTLISSLTFTLNVNPNAQPTLHSIVRPAVANQTLYDQSLLHIIDNAADIGRFYPGGTVVAKPFWTWHVPAYEYVVVTSRNLIPAYQEIVGWKRRKGLDAGVVAIEDILADPAAAAGDVVSHINDNAGKLRQYLSDAYQQGTVYALLGGDSSIIPLRYAAGLTNSYNAGSEGDARIPSDLYYTDFNGNWNVDGPDPDGVRRYGEPYDDAVDFHPEIFVGRILSETELEVKHHLHKIIRYERDPGYGDNAYVGNAFFVQADQMTDDHQAQTVLSHFPFYSQTIWSEHPSGSDHHPNFPNATSVVDQIEKYWGMVSLIGHGSPNNIAVATYDYNGCPLTPADGPLKQKVTCLDGVDGWCAPTQPGNGLDNFDDFNYVTTPYQNYPSVFYTVACETTPFDLWLKDGNTPDMAEVWTKFSRAGMAAYMGNTRYGWVYSSYDMFSDWGDQVMAGNTRIGVAEGLAKTVFYDDWDKKTHVLVGCPEMDLWTAKPSTFSSANVEGTSTVTVHTGGVSGADICVMSALDNGTTYHQMVRNVAGTSYTFTGVPANYAVAITKHNYLPFLWKTDVYLQNYTFTGVAYIASDNLYAGENVNTSQPSGTLLIKSTANVIFDGQKDIILDKGFELEKGASFEAK